MIIYLKLLFLFFFFHTLEADCPPLDNESNACTDVLPANLSVMRGANGVPNMPAVTPTFSQLPVTNKVWTSLLWKQSLSPTNDSRFSAGLPLHPLIFQARAGGLSIGYSDMISIEAMRRPDSNHTYQGFSYPNVFDFTVSLEGLTADMTRVEKYSDWTVTPSWSGQGKTLEATIGHGLPFAYFRIKNGIPGKIKVSFSNMPLEVKAQDNGAILWVTVSQTHHYGIFAPSGSVWQKEPNNVYTSTLNGKDYLSVALLPDASLRTLNFFNRRAYAFVDSSQVSYQYVPNRSRVESTYEVTTTLMEQSERALNRTVLALYRHHWLHSPTPLTDFSYISSHGEMKVVDGNSFQTRISFHGIMPTLPPIQNNIDTSSLEVLNNLFNRDERPPLSETSHMYWGGKPTLRLSQLAQVASVYKKTDIVTDVIAKIKKGLEYRFTYASEKKQFFYYDKIWKTLIGFPASYGSDNGNDHHLHYGYFLHAAATVAQFDPNWAKEWGPKIELLIRDANNPNRNDPYFPFFRSFDIYAGHGWSEGSQASNGNNQSSSSESMTFASGLIFWGSQTKNQILRDAGIFLYATERTAIFQYWFDLNNQIFPKACWFSRAPCSDREKPKMIPKLASNTQSRDFLPPAIGIVGSQGMSYANDWGGTIFETHGINFIPLHGGSLYLALHPRYLKKNFDYMFRNQYNKGVWFDDILMTQAFYNSGNNPDNLGGAIYRWNQKTNTPTHKGMANLSFTPVGVNSYSTIYHHIHSLNQMGCLDSTVLANTPHYAVFSKVQGVTTCPCTTNCSNGVRNYVVYNPEDAPITVLFTDNVIMTVPPHEIKLFSRPLASVSP